MLMIILSVIYDTFCTKLMFIKTMENMKLISQLKSMVFVWFQQRKQQWTHHNGHQNVYREMSEVLILVIRKRKYNADMSHIHTQKHINWWRNCDSGHNFCLKLSHAILMCQVERCRMFSKFEIANTSLNRKKLSFN